MTTDEAPQHHIRNALALLLAHDERVIGPTGVRITYDAETIASATARLWTAVAQLEKRSE